MKVTPAHDPNDYACGLRHKLPMINILNPDGTINENGGPYAGPGPLQGPRAGDRGHGEARPVRGPRGPRHPAEAQRPQQDADRAVPVGPVVREDGRRDGSRLAQMAMDAVTAGRVKFFPERYAKTYLDWLGEKRDWCISRQLWWGHRIPIWYARCPEARAEEGLRRPHRRDLAARRGERPVAGLRAGGPRPPTPWARSTRLEQDPDVLDTWFSSALWPHSTLGWPEPDARSWRYYYPTSVLVTSRDIITLWVARMVITGLYNVGKVPFHHVYIHPKILDGFGETMSKTQGQRRRSARHHRPLRHRRPALRHGAPGDRDAGQPDAGGQRLPALRHAGAGEARAHVHADAQGDLSRVQEAVPPRRPLAGATTRSCRRPSRRRSASSWAATSPTSCGTPPASCC